MSLPDLQRWVRLTLAEIRTALRATPTLAGTGVDAALTMIHDGRIDPATRSMMGARRGHVLGIGRLNMLYQIQFGENAHARLFADPLFPPELYEDFCRRCAARLQKDFPEESRTIARIAELSPFFA